MIPMFWGVLSMIQGNSYKILLVDDDPNCLDAIDQLMQRDGYETLPISEGRSAVKVIMEDSIDLAIVDYNLPDMDGLNIIRQIKRTKPYIPVIMVTAQPSNELKMASLAAGAYSFMSKPINIPVLRQIVAEALQFPQINNGEIRRKTVFVKWIRWIIHK